jgi:hypothetical protein
VLSRLVCGSALACLLAAGALAWGIGVRYRGYHYDEVLRAHEVWLASQGLRPYHEFCDDHPPYFAMLAPLISRSHDPYNALVILRVWSSLCNLCFVGGLVALSITSIKSGRAWAVIGTAAIAFRPDVLGYLVEFRVDGLAHAVAAWGLFRARRGRFLRLVELGFVTGLASMLFSPKTALLPPLFVLALAFTERKRARELIRPVGGYAAGMAVALLVCLLVITAQKISLWRTYELVVLFVLRYNAILRESVGHGLLKAITSDVILTPLIAAGSVAWIAGLIRRRETPDAYHIGLAAWLAAQAWMVSLPYKQYSAPWFLFASGFLAFLGPFLAHWPRGVHVASFLVACILVIAPVLSQAATWYRQDAAGYQRNLIGFMERLATPGDRVVAAAPHHPVFRRDVFYLLFNVYDPGGRDADQILDGFPDLRESVSADRYREELAAHPPAFIVLRSGSEHSPYTARQDKVMEEFTGAHGYKRRLIGGVWFAIRPDRAN